MLCPRFLSYRQSDKVRESLDARRPFPSASYPYPLSSIYSSSCVPLSVQMSNRSLRSAYICSRFQVDRCKIATLALTSAVCCHMAYDGWSNTPKRIEHAGFERNDLATPLVGVLLCARFICPRAAASGERIVPAARCLMKGKPSEARRTDFGSKSPEQVEQRSRQT